MIWLTAFLTGLLGSFHCVGMCGPIALATPIVGVSPAAKVWSKLLYNLGRISTYALLGAILGGFGWGLKLAGWQQSISIAVGVVMVLVVLGTTKKISLLLKNPFVGWQSKLTPQLFNNRTYTALFAIGLLNGLLPCGLVYMGLLGAVATQSAAQGALFMALFGLGTMPMMFAVSMVGLFLPLTTRNHIKKFTPVFTLLLACLFIMRGLNLGVPYLSPKLTHQQERVAPCCAPNQVKK
jgi:uncharacterized protein